MPAQRRSCNFITLLPESERLLFRHQPCSHQAFGGWGFGKNLSTPRTSTRAWGGLLLVSLSGFCGINRRQRRQDRGIWLHHDVDVCRCVDRTTLDPVKMDTSFILFEGIPAAEVLWVLTVSRKPRRSLVAENLDHFCFAARPPRTHPPSSFYFSRFAFSVFVAVLVFEFHRPVLVACVL